MQNPPGNFHGKPYGIRFGAQDGIGAGGSDIRDRRGQAVDHRAGFGFQGLSGNSLAGTQAGFIGLAGFLFGCGVHFRQPGAKL